MLKKNKFEGFILPNVMTYCKVQESSYYDINIKINKEINGTE